MHPGRSAQVTRNSRTEGPEQTGATDQVDEIAAAWQRERPHTPVESIGVVTRVWQLAKLFGDDRRRLLAASGIDPATLDLLSALRRSGPPYTLNTRELAAQSLVTAGAISQRLNRAEQEGLITRQPAEGRSRAVLVELTEAGHDLVEKTVDQVLNRETALLSDLTPEQADQLTVLLRSLLHEVQERLGAHGVSHVGHP